MKRLLALTLSIILAASSILCVNFTAVAADIIASGSCGADGNNVSWSLDSDNVMTITGANQRMADYYSGAPWSAHKDNIKKLIISDGVINIGACAFKDCTNLEEVSFGTIDTLGENAFNNCTSLKRAILPDNCTWIWASAFSGCTSLQCAYINAVNSYSGSVPDGMFNGCTSLAVLELGSSINKLGANSLSNCTGLRALIINANSFSINDNSALNNVNKGDCCIVSTSNSLSSFASSNGFAYSASKSGVASDNTYSSTNLTYNWDTKSCTLSFTGSGDMFNRGESKNYPWFMFMNGCQKVDFSHTDGRVTLSTTAFQGREAIEELDLTNVYAVGWGTFAECSSIKRLHFDSHIEAIWNYAFANDFSIDTITFEGGNNSLHIYPFAFNNCNGTTYWLDLPANTEYIDDHAFINTNFNFVKIFSESVTIGEDAFGNGEGGYARFFGPDGKNTGVYDFVKNHRENKGYNWHYYCVNGNHIYTTQTVAPTCYEQGYDSYGCHYCDDDKVLSNFVAPKGHSYRLTSINNSILVYECTRCGKNNIEIPAIEVVNYFRNAISTQADNNILFNQSNYDGRVDLDINGVVNAKDFSLIRNAVNTRPNVTNKQTTINLNNKHQTIEGFGASAAWWSQTVGGSENADEIMTLLYDKNDGIGLNIYRYNLGAGSRDINDTTMYIDDERTNCFLQSNGTYNWNNDANAMNALALAQEHNPYLRLTLFSNSPPVYMTKNGKAYLDPNASVNIDTNRYQDFANFTVTCAEHFIDLGYDVREVSPINEPEWGWNGWVNGDGTTSCGQEGCHWDYDKALDFYNNYMIPTLKNSSKCNGKVGVSVWESGQMRHSDHWSNYLNNLFSSKATRKIGSWVIDQGYAENNSNIRSYVDAVDIHSYWADADARRNVKSDITGSNFSYLNGKVRCTEYCQMYNDYNTGVVAHINAEGGSTNGMTIDYGLAMADIIYQDMTILDAVEWDWWTAVGRGVYTDSLIYVRNGNHSYETSKRLWCLGNYSKFIEEGAQRVDVTTGTAFGANLNTNAENIYEWVDEYDNHVVDRNNYIEQSAYLNPDGSVVIVYINNSDTTEYTVFDSEQFDTFTSYVTSADKNLERFQSDSTENVACIPARSVTTVVLKKEMKLNNPNATIEAQNVFNYIVDTFGNGVITGQQESTWMNNNPDYEMDYIQNTTGKLPAIRGLDFINDDFSGVVSRAKSWWNRGGIVTICWHCSKNFDKGYNESKSVDDSNNVITANCLTQDEWNAIFTTGSPENRAALAAMDKAGNALLELKQAGVPVIWRPFHEFDGGWFWWGQGGAENFKKLWILMYNHFTYDLGLDNLIWMLGYCHNGTQYGANLADWYPGDQYCDIIGADSYEVSQNGAEQRLYDPVRSVCSTKPMAMHECSLIPTAAQFREVRWVYFMTWHTTYLTSDNNTQDLNKIYNSSWAITLDELPNLK